MFVDNLSANSFSHVSITRLLNNFVEQEYFNCQLKNILTTILFQYTQKKTEKEFQLFFS